MSDYDSVDERQDERQDAYEPYKTFWRRGDDEDDAIASDWTIVLKSLDTADRVEIYHVHKYPFLTGKYTSEYFETVFTVSGNIPEHHDSNHNEYLETFLTKTYETITTMTRCVQAHDSSKTTHLTFHDGMLDLFPFVLDCLYGVYDDVKSIAIFETQYIKNFGVVAKGAVAILSLARYFAIKELVKITEHFIMIIVRDVLRINLVGSLSLGELFSFLLFEAALYEENKMAGVLIAACARKHASGNVYTKSMIMDGIPSSTKQRVLELSHSYLQKYLHTLQLSRIKDSKNADEMVCNYEKSQACVRVTGAGVKAVNGTYYFIECSKCNGGIRNLYQKIGMWDGREETFSIFKADNDSWYKINIFPRDKKPSRYTNTCFYTNEGVKEYGIEPTPKIIGPLKNDLSEDRDDPITSE